MSHEELEELIKRCQNGNASSEDKAFLEDWYLHFNKSDWYVTTEDERTSDADLAWGAIQKNTRKAQKIKLWPRIIAAAAILIAVSFGIYFYLGPANTQIPQAAKPVSPDDIAPGGNKASLTLADGRKIILTDAVNGELALQSGVKIIKAADGQLIYLISDSDQPSQLPLYNTIETPAGGQYQVSLPDGSRVWLNSASSLKYPVRFKGRERKVEITGEAYFEVAKNAAMPFRVKNVNQTIEVLGTHFNVMSYSNEGTINTTLLEGSVRILTNNGNKTLTPGQQARNGNNGVDVITVDTEEVTAWKNGFFIFKSEDVHSIMRQISRWYDVEIEIHGDISGKTFGGRISRSRNVSEVLEVLESTGSLKFKILNGGSPGKERRIIAMP